MLKDHSLPIGVLSWYWHAKIQLNHNFIITCIGQGMILLLHVLVKELCKACRKEGGMYIGSFDLGHLKMFNAYHNLLYNNILIFTVLYMQIRKLLDPKLETLPKSMVTLSILTAVFHSLRPL